MGRDKKTIVIGSRESKLAVIQSEMVMERIRTCHPELSVELVTMKTTGDMILDRRLDEIGGKGLFVKELDQALADGRIDLSVHSLKDMPMEISPEAPIVAFSKREDPRDVLILPQDSSQEGKAVQDGLRSQGGEAAQDGLRSQEGKATQEFMPNGGPQDEVPEPDLSKPFGTSSRRRALQLADLYPGSSAKSVRGNVITRLAKLESEDLCGLILAGAGLIRLGLSHRISRIFSTQEMIPAAGQGILAVQGRAGEDYSYLDCVEDGESRMAALAERAFVRELDGGCSAPIAAYGQLKSGRLELTGLYFDEKTGYCVVGRDSASPEMTELLGIRLARRLKKEARS